MSRQPRTIGGFALIGAGLVLALWGNLWAPWAFRILGGWAIGAWIELFVPFLPMALIGFGAMLFVPEK